MTVKGVRQVRQNVGKWVVDTRGRKTRQVLTGIAMTAQSYAKLWTPTDTNTLVNSLTFKMFGDDRVVVWYRSGFSKNTGFNYAEFLHNTTKWSPSKKPAATHHFLSRAFEDPEPQADFKRTMEEIYSR